MLLASCTSAQAQSLQLGGPGAEVSNRHASLVFGGGIVAMQASQFEVQAEAGTPEQFSSWDRMLSSGVSVDTEVTPVRPGIVRVEWTVKIPERMQLTRVAARLEFEPGDPAAWTAARTAFHWIPQIRLSPEQVSADHVFRSPAAIVTAGHTGVAVIPDLETLADNRPVSSFMDLRFPDHGPPSIWYGFEATKPAGHRYFAPTGAGFAPANSQLRFACYVLIFQDETAQQMLRGTVGFLWEKYGRQYSKMLLPQTVAFGTAAQDAYPMALTHFWSPGPKPGTGGFSESSSFDQSTGTWGGRWTKGDVWFQSWFNNMRTAYGLRYWGGRLRKPEWTAHAGEIANLLMQSPSERGLFATVYFSETKKWNIAAQGGGGDYYYIPDDAWAALWLLRYEQDFEPVAGAGERLLALAHTLLRLQSPDGGFPARVHEKTLVPDPLLNGTASEAMPLWFLAEMIQAGRLPPAEIDQATAAVRLGAKHLREHVIAPERFEDFELYFSCSPKPVNYFDAISQLHGESNLAMQWTAEALLAAYRLDQDPADLSGAEFSLDMMSLFQQIWNPPYLHLYAFGGFGVMNTDAEWNDARESQFAETYSRFYEETGNPEYMERGIAALRASFTLMVIPENRLVSPATFTGSSRDVEIEGGESENYGHTGGDDRAFQTGFDWGSGSALAGAAYFKRRYGDLFIDGRHRTAFGIDGTVVKAQTWAGDAVDMTTGNLNPEHAEDMRIRTGAQNALGLNIRKTPVSASNP